MKIAKKFFWLHLIHGILITSLLFSGAFLYSDRLKTLFNSLKYEVRMTHAILGTVYFLFVCAIIPYIYKYLKQRRSWQKTFHISLFGLFCLAWMASGLYLWGNPNLSFGIRQFALDIHDVLSVFIFPWILGHIFLWFLNRNKTVKPKRTTQSNGGELVTRREVLLLFSGILISFLFGGILRWFQPISDSFLTKLGGTKRRGYFRIYSLRNDSPVYNPQTWRLAVTGLVENPVELSFEELTKLPKHIYTHDFHCVTGWSVTSVKWEGIPFPEIASLVKNKGEFVKMYSSDQLYTETYTIDQLMRKDVLLVYNLDDEPLIQSQGAPLRLFHPDMYGYKSIKWVSKIEFTNTREQGYWEEKEGYDQNGFIA